MSARRILVIGGTGFLGRRISEHLLAGGDQVAVLSRGTRQPDSLQAVEYITADRNDPAVLAGALRGRDFDAVIDNVAFNAADVRSVLDPLGGQVGHYLLTSSAAVYHHLLTRYPVAEHEADLSLRLPVDAPGAFHPRLGQAYGNGKREAEELLFSGRYAVPWTVLRPPIVVGDDDRTMRVWWFVQRLQDGGPIVIPSWGPGRIFQVVWVHDLARAFVAAAANSNAYGKAYNVVQPELYTAETWIEACAGALGVQPPPTVSVPDTELDAVGLPGYAMPIAGRWLGHILLDNHALRRDLDFTYSPEATWLTDCVRGCAAVPPPQPSAHYDRRALEIQVAEGLLGAQSVSG